MSGCLRVSKTNCTPKDKRIKSGVKRKLILESLCNAAEAVEMMSKQLSTPLAKMSPTSKEAHHKSFVRRLIRHLTTAGVEKTQQLHLAGSRNGSGTGSWNGGAEYPDNSVSGLELHNTTTQSRAGISGRCCCDKDYYQ